MKKHRAILKCIGIAMLFTAISFIVYAIVQKQHNHKASVVIQAQTGHAHPSKPTKPGCVNVGSSCSRTNKTYCCLGSKCVGGWCVQAGEGGGAIK